MLTSLLLLPIALAAPPAPQIPADWPREIVADVGPLQVRLESRSFWTLYRIDYKGTRLGIDRWGSHYGSVILFPDVGFIGSGHTENENEKVLEARLLVDGQKADPPQALIKCERLRLERRSRIRAFVLDSVIEVADGRIVEEVRLRAEQPTPVKLIYHFMHPWTVTATEYLAELEDGQKVEGAFRGDKGFRIDRPARWSAIYDGPSGKGAVTILLESPPGDEARTCYWDQPERYRKHYLRTFQGKTVPADRELRYRACTVPFEAAEQRWKEVAREIAGTEKARK